MLLQTYTVHNIQLTAKPLNLVEWRAEGANLIGRLTFASSVWSLDRKCQWWRVSICVWVCSRSLWTKLAGHVSARAQVSPITRAILLHVIEVTLCRITKLHNAQVSRLRVCIDNESASPPTVYQDVKSASVLRSTTNSAADRSHKSAAATSLNDVNAS